MDNMINPFASFGNIVYGKRFIGRAEALRQIESRMLNPDTPGNLAIVGLRRVGKSSLVWHKIIWPRSEYIERKKLTYWIYMGTINSPEAFIRTLVEVCYKELNELGWLTNAMKESVRRLLPPDPLEFQSTSKIESTDSPSLAGFWKWLLGLFQKNSLSEEVEKSITTDPPLIIYSDLNDIYLAAKRFFNLTYKAGIRPIFVLDEFDYAIQLFKGDLTCFQKLRELSIDPNCGVGFITTSLRTIKEIETQSISISTLDGTFMTYYLGMYNSVDLRDSYTRMESVGINLRQEDKHRILYYTGGHPFLLDKLSYEITEQYFRDQQINVDGVAHSVNVHSAISAEYESIQTNLSKLLLLDSLLKVLEDPAENKHDDFSRLFSYGVLTESHTSNNVPNVFSENFKNYITSTEGRQNRPLRKGEYLRGDRYEIIEVVSTRHNSNSFVYKAIDHVAAKQKVAIKEPYFFYEVGITPTELVKKRAKLREEVMILAHIDHAYISKVADFIDERYIVQNWVDGKSLREIIKGDKDLSQSTIQKIGIQVCMAMGHVFSASGVLHRDIKPEHIYLCPDDNIRIIDFGLSRAQELASATYLPGTQDIGSGTWSYMAPEQFDGHEDHRSDIYSLGITLYELITHQLPFHRGSPNELYTGKVRPDPYPMNLYRSDIAIEIEHAIQRSIEYASGNRYQTWKEFEQALSSVKFDESEARSEG